MPLAIMHHSWISVLMVLDAWILMIKPLGDAVRSTEEG
jgi:hypothetical protein